MIPTSYLELQKLYGSHIKKLLFRCNRVERNFEDLHSYVWVKLLEARLLERFEEFVRRQNPKVLTAIEACDLLGVSWYLWVQAFKGYHTGKRKVWMPTPVNAEEFRNGDSWLEAPNAMFAYLDILEIAGGERINGKVCWAFKHWGMDVRNGVVLAWSRPEKNLKLPVVKPTPNQFKNYLNMAVMNHYANFCRTLTRRHKERPQHDRGDCDQPVVWEDTLVEEKQAPAELVVALSEARELLAETIHDCLQEFGIESQDAELKVFAQLQEGASLLQALKTTGLPTRVRDSVVSSIRAIPDGEIGV